MKDASLNHLHVADSDATRALTITRSLETSYKVHLANEDDPDTNLNHFITPIPPNSDTNSASTSNVAGAIAMLDPLVPGWNSPGSQQAQLGTLSYIIRKYFLGSQVYKGGPILLLGMKQPEEIAELSIDRFGFDLLKVPGLKYGKLPEKAMDIGLFVARQFEYTLSKWRAASGKNDQPENWLLLERNRQIASGLFEALRREARPLVHTYNALRATGEFHEVRPDGRWHTIDVLAVYADRHLQYSSAPSRPEQFREILSRFHAVVRQLLKEDDSAKRIELIQQMSRPLSDLESLLTWWESLIAWSSFGIARERQTIHSLIVDDDATFASRLEVVLQSEAFATQLKELLGRPILVEASTFLPNRAPEEVIRSLRQHRFHEVDSMSGSPVVVFQDLILHSQADFGLRVIRSLRSRYPWLRIVALTSREKARFEILEAGADIYLNKTDLLQSVGDGEERISSGRLIENIRTILQPSSVLIFGSDARIKSDLFTLMCERYWLDPNPIPISGEDLTESLRKIRPEAGLPRLLLIALTEKPELEQFTQNLVSIRRLCLLFPELVIILWRPGMKANDKGVSNIGHRWFELWAKWIPDYASRVLPIDREAGVAISSPWVHKEGSGLPRLSLIFSAAELAAAESLLRRSAPLPKLAAYNFYVPRRKSPEGATGSIASPTKVETEVADKIASRFGGSSVSVIHGRWIGEKGSPDYDTVVAIESFAPATRANRAFALKVVEEIRARLKEEAVLQIERPISVISRDDEEPPFFLAPGLCDINGSVDGARLYEDIVRIATN
jgi:CheY-like chemotaxis protein